MGYKRIGETMSFAALGLRPVRPTPKRARRGEPTPRRDIALSKSMENNRSVKMMKRINKVIKWKNIEALLLEYYDVEKSKEGADAYPPLMLLKCMLLQECLRPGGNSSERVSYPVGS